jgi:ribosomal protein S18 acetylase RimI-like enzyme
MDSSVEMITVDDADKAAEHGFFCYKSRPKSEGYRRKLAWLEQRFAEGLQIKIIREDGRSVGFIEYTPGEFAWRPIKAQGYLFVHCLWVVGRAKEKGYGSRLLDACVEDARAMATDGVAAVTKRGGHLVGKKLFLKHGFEVVDRAPPAFELAIRTFGDAPPPAFPQDWEERQARYGAGLTVVYADQCPYFHDAVQQTLETAEEVGVQARQAVELQSAGEVQDLAPSPYGTFSIVYDGTLLAHTPLSAKRLAQRLEERFKEGET